MSAEAPRDAVGTDQAGTDDEREGRLRCLSTTHIGYCGPYCEFAAYDQRQAAEVRDGVR